MEQPILTEKVLRNYSIIEFPGTTRCTVASTILPHQVVQDTHPYYVVNLRLITRSNYKKLKEILMDEPYLNFIDYKDYFLSGFLYESQIKEGFDLPIKGEEVIIKCKYFNGSLLQVSNISLLPRYTTKRIDNDIIQPYLNLFKTYFNEKSNNESDLSENGEYPIPEL